MPSGKDAEVDHWQMSMAAMGAIPGNDLDKIDINCVVDLVASGSVPSVAKGSSAFALKNSMEGNDMDQAPFPKAYQSFGNYTVKGGYKVPEDSEDK